MSHFTRLGHFHGTTFIPCFASYDLTFGRAWTAWTATEGLQTLANGCQDHEPWWVASTLTALILSSPSLLSMSDVLALLHKARSAIHLAQLIILCSILNGSDI